MRAIHATVRWIEALTGWVGRAAAWLTAAMVAVICLNVGLRYLGGRSLLALQDAGWYMFSVVFLMGAAWTLRDDRHVRVDVLYAAFSQRTKLWIDLAGTVFFLLPFCVLGVVTSLDFVANSWAIQETSPDPGGLPARYLVKTVIPTAFVLMGLQGIANGLRVGLRLAGQVPPPHPRQQVREEHRGV